MTVLFMSVYRISDKDYEHTKFDELIISNESNLFPRDVYCSNSATRDYAKNIFGKNIWSFLNCF